MGQYSQLRTPRVIAGNGSVSRFVDELLADHSSLALITGTDSYVSSGAERVVARSAARDADRFVVRGEPSASLVDSIVGKLGQRKPDVVVAIGGGSVLDTGKAVSAMLCEEGSVESYLEGVGSKSPSGRRARLAVAPTTAGTGSEASSNAVITRVGEDGYKRSLRHENFVPDLVALDPALLAGAPRQVIAAAGLDAITQLLEAFVSRKASPATDLYAREGLVRARSLERILTDAADESAWADISVAAYYSGIALANAGLGIVHGLASPLGALRNAPHGAICGALLPGAIGVVRRKISDDSTAGEGLRRYSEAGRLLGNRDEVGVGSGLDLLEEVVARLSSLADLPGIGHWGHDSAALDRVASEASPKNTPCDLSVDEIRMILDEAVS